MSLSSVIHNAAVVKSKQRSNTPAAEQQSTASTPRIHQARSDRELREASLISSSHTSPHVPPDQTISDDSPSQTSQERKRRHSRNTRGSSRRPRPPHLSSKSSSAVPTLSTTQASPAPQSPSRNSPKPSGASSPRSWLGRSITMASLHQQGAHPSNAADLLRQAMMHG